MKFGEKFIELKSKGRPPVLKTVPIAKEHVLQAIEQYLKTLSIIDDDHEVVAVDVTPKNVTYRKEKKEVFKTKANGKAG